MKKTEGRIRLKTEVSVEHIYLEKCRSESKIQAILLAFVTKPRWKQQKKRSFMWAFGRGGVLEFRLTWMREVGVTSRLSFATL